MITNQLMTRRMGKFSVTQRTKDGFFNATELLKQWNTSASSKKQMVHYTELESTKEFITAIIDEEKLKERNHVLLQTRQVGYS